MYPYWKHRLSPVSAFDGLGVALRALRERRSLTQAQAAERTGIGQSRISAYEGGDQLMEVETLGRMLDAYGADVLDLGKLLHPTNEEEGAGGVDSQVMSAVQLLVQAGLEAGTISRQDVERIAPNLAPPKARPITPKQANTSGTARRKT